MSGTISYQIPVAGQPNSTEDAKVATALTTILSSINGGLDGTNLAAVLAQAATVNQAGQTVKGAVSIAGAETRSNVAYGTLATPDQVTGIVLPSNGLITVWYQAAWQESVLSAGSAAIFIGANQTKIGASGAASPGVQSAFIGGSWPTSTNCLLSTNSNGLSSLQGQVMPTTFAYGGDVTTGQVVGATIGLQTGMTTGQNIFQGGPCHIFAAAGTYTISVQFKASSGSVTASGRKLWVQAISFA